MLLIQTGLLLHPHLYPRMNHNNNNKFPCCLWACLNTQAIFYATFVVISTAIFVMLTLQPAMILLWFKDHIAGIFMKHGYIVQRFRINMYLINKDGIIFILSSKSPEIPHWNSDQIVLKAAGLHTQIEVAAQVLYTKNYNGNCDKNCIKNCLCKEGTKKKVRTGQVHSFESYAPHLPHPPPPLPWWVTLIQGACFCRYMYPIMMQSSFKSI